MLTLDALTALIAALTLIQAILGVRVVWRLIRTMGGRRISNEGAVAQSSMPDVTIVLPVLNERLRVGPCLDGLIAQGSEVGEILVVDGGSSDGTQALIADYHMRDPRVRLLDGSPVPADWNGKAWGLHVGLTKANPAYGWLLTVDADVRPTAAMTHATLTQASATHDDALSVATQQEIVGFGEGIVHPALLATLIYRFGAPGRSIRRVSEVQANGQCMLFRRAALEAVGGFAVVRESICEDITIARLLVDKGYTVGFYEAGDLVSVRMYSGWRETWQNWTRSLPMRDRYFGLAGALGLFEVVFIQAAPLGLLLFSGVALAFARMLPQSLWLALTAALVANVALVAIRLGVLAGAAHAYRQRPWSYWLSPVCDIPIAAQLSISALRRRHSWRGRPIIRGGSGS